MDRKENARFGLMSMQHSQMTETVRGMVLSTMAEMGLRGEEGVRESILIRGGSYCGRKFETAHGHAIWFLEENQVKFYAEGTLVKVSHVALPPVRLVRVAA